MVMAEGKVFTQYDRPENIEGEFVIPEGVTKIEGQAFARCSGLTSIVIPNSVTRIDAHAFMETGLQSVVVPDSVKFMGEEVFKGCKNLTSAKIGDVEIPCWVPLKSTGLTMTFMGCPNLTKLELPEYYKNVDGVIYNLDMTAVLLCLKDTKEVVIPDSVTTIYSYAFLNCTNLTSVVIPQSVNFIGFEAFAGCEGLKKVALSDNLEFAPDKRSNQIAHNTFAGCTSLTEFEVSENNRYYIAIDGVLYNKEKTVLVKCPTGKKSVTIPDSVTEIGVSAFQNTSTDLKSGIYSELESIEIPESVTTIGDHAFASTNISEIVVPKSVRKIDEGIFAGCHNLKSAVLNCSLRKILKNTFAGCSSLTNVVVPGAVKKIEDHAFSQCTSLKEIEIPEGAEVEEGAFVYCSDELNIVRFDPKAKKAKEKSSKK